MLIKMLKNWDETGLLEFIKHFKKANPNKYQEPPLTDGTAEGFYKEALSHLERYDDFLKPILYPTHMFSGGKNLLVYVPFCGPGIETIKLTEKCPHVKVIAFDISEDMIKFARDFSQKFAISCRRRSTFLHESVENIGSLFKSYGIPTIIIARRGLHGLKRDKIDKLVSKICNNLPVDGFFYNMSFRSDLDEEDKKFLLKELETRRGDGREEFLLNASSFLLALLNAPTFEEYLGILKYSCVNGYFAIKRRLIDIEFLYIKNKAILETFEKEERENRWDFILDV